MFVALIARDKPGAIEVRKANRADHLAYIEASGVVVMAGPMLNDDGEMAGSLIILNVPDMASARAWARDDPYARAGLFDSVTLNEWIRAVG